MMDATTMNKKRMAIMLAASVLVFGGVFGFVAFRNAMIAKFFANMPTPVIAVTVEPARAEQWTSSLSTVGTLSAVNGVDIAAAAAGLVKEIQFESGQAVKKGQMLLKLDSDVEMGDLRSAQADAELARLTARRSETLVKSGAVSQSAVDKSDAELKAREAKVAGIRAQIEKKAVFAPFDGVLGVRKIDLGQYLQPGQAVVNLQNLSVILADFTVSQRDLSVVVPGQTLMLTTDSWPDRVFEGAVSAIEPQVDAKTGMIGVQGRFANTEGLLRPGMFAKVAVMRSASTEVVTIPESAIAYSLHGDSVFIVHGDTVERAVVQLGDRRQGRVAVAKGVRPGDQVVTSGQLKLSNGAKVELAGEDPLKAAAAKPTARE